MGKFIFEPKVGMRTNNSFMHGVGENEYMCTPGTIEHVGEDYFILRVHSEPPVPVFVSKVSYWLFEPNNFQ